MTNTCLRCICVCLPLVITTAGCATIGEPVQPLSCQPAVRERPLSSRFTENDVLHHRRGAQAGGLSGDEASAYCLEESPTTQWGTGGPAVGPNGWDPAPSGPDAITLGPDLSFVSPGGDVPPLAPSVGWDYLPQDDQTDTTFLGVVGEQCGRVCSDYMEFYSCEGLTWLAAGVGAGALMANTGFDEHFMRDAFADNVVRAPSDEFYEMLHEPKFLGDGWYTIPVFAVAALSEPLVADCPLGEVVAHWGQRCLRTIAVGGPPVLALQWLTGGSRPGETSAGSQWKPLQDNNGVSGHAFMGAIPFVSAAKMTDNPWLKAGFYAVSVLPALSRVNDDQHYFSQVFLGWWLAYLAAGAVDRTEIDLAGLHLYPMITDREVGLYLERSF
jgi:membrane-associated phospholipid phosphatase